MALCLCAGSTYLFDPFDLLIHLHCLLAHGLGCACVFVLYATRPDIYRTCDLSDDFVLFLFLIPSGLT